MELAKQFMPLSHMFNKLNNLEARMLDSQTYHNIKTTLNHICQDFVIVYAKFLSFPDTTSCEK